jgi:hypothetical protein
MRPLLLYRLIRHKHTPLRALALLWAFYRKPGAF